ncbi:MAG: CopG family transcriptional regulator [Rubrobacteraceae bacterium]
MKKTTVYLPDDLKVALERAAVRGRSEAELIREVVRDLTGDLERPKPKLPLFSSGDPAHPQSCGPSVMTPWVF